MVLFLGGERSPCQRSEQVLDLLVKRVFLTFY